MYFLGSSHSGSTVLAGHLGMSSGIEMVGELGSISRVLNDPRRLCTCGREYSQCPIWGRIRLRLGRFALPTSAVNEGQSRLIFDNRGMLSEIGLAFGHGGLIVDTSKKISRLKYLAAEGINTKVIHLVKDPQTVVLSERRSAQRKATALDGISLPNFSPKENGRAIFNWIEVAAYDSKGLFFCQ